MNRYLFEIFPKEFISFSIENDIIIHILINYDLKKLQETIYAIHRYYDFDHDYF